MALLIGQVLKGRTASYKITKILKAPTVFQAKIVPFEHAAGASQPSKLAVIKHFPADLSRMQYDREVYNYSVPSIAKSPYIRSLLERIGHDEPSSSLDEEGQPQCMVFEWMETDLWQLPSRPFRSGSQLPRIVARSVLEALAVLESEGGVHTDVNPNNVFLSDVCGDEPIVKLGDLGNAMGIGPMGKVRYQGVAIRAPEVWKDEPITSKADIWSLGVTLAHWMASKMIFGAADKMIENLTEHWCIAKIIRLVGPIAGPNSSKTDIVDEFALAEFLAKKTFVHPETGAVERYIKVGTIREELEKVEGRIEAACIDFIESLLVVDPLRRPSAKEALRHRWLNGDDGGGDSDWSVD